MPNYAAAQQVSPTDTRLKTEYATVPSPNGNGSIRGYLARPASAGTNKLPAILVVHENRGLNPHIEDVARRAAVEGFLALAPDGLSPVGGYPGNDDDGRTLQRDLTPAELDQDMINSARFLKAHALSSGSLGATGFCWGGGMTNRLAVELGADLNAGVPFYGAAPASEDVERIEAAMLIIYAGTDERINAMWPDYQAALAQNGVRHEMEIYPGSLHGFHNNSTPRYNETAAGLAWNRTVQFFRDHLS
jgi:carboxymethylenebutenolidase